MLGLVWRDVTRTPTPGSFGWNALFRYTLERAYDVMQFSCTLLRVVKMRVGSKRGMREQPMCCAISCLSARSTALQAKDRNKYIRCRPDGNFVFQETQNSFLIFLFFTVYKASELRLFVKVDASKRPATQQTSKRILVQRSNSK